MNLFEKVTQSPAAFAEFVSADKDNRGCGDCSYQAECTGRDYCKQVWMMRLVEEAE